MAATGPGYDPAVPSRVTVLERRSAGRSYPEIGRELGIAPGLAYLVATGLPADGSPPVGRRPRPAGWLPEGGTHLANPPAVEMEDDPGLPGWVAARAAADPSMAEAAAAGRLAAPDPGDDDVVALLRADHHAIRALAAEVAAIPARGSHADAVRRAEATERLRRHLAAHEAAEERRFWPVVRDGVPNGEALARHARAQERHGRDLHRGLARLPADASERLARTDELLRALRAHLAFEASVLLAVEEAVGLEQRRAVGRRLRRAAGHHATRARPGARDGG